MLTSHYFQDSKDPYQSMVIFIHGYGAKGQNILSLGQTWQQFLPKTLFVAPDAPTICDQYVDGYQWFSIEDRSPPTRLAYLKETRKLIETYIMSLCEQHHIPLNKIFIVGFSMGGMITMDLRCHGFPCAGFISYSGAFYPSQDVPATSTAPLLVVHGEQDDVLPISYHEKTIKDLSEMGITFQEKTYPYLDHSINPEGAELGLNFIKSNIS